MSNLLRRTIGILLILTAIGGLVISIIGIVGLWQLKPTLTSALTDGVTLASDTLKATSTGLVAIDDSLTGAVNSMQALQDALRTTGETIRSTDPMLATVTDLMNGGLPKTIRATQTSLDTAQESAKIIDTVLEALSIFPFVTYDPEKPLHESLNEVSENLGEFPKSFSAIAQSLDNSRSQMEILQADLALMAEAIGQIEEGLDQSEATLDQYKRSVETVLTQLEAIEDGIPTFVDRVIWIGSIFLVWLALAQIGLFMQGLSYVNANQIQNPDTHEYSPVEA